MTDRYSRPKLVEPRPLAFHLTPTGEDENPGTPLFYEVISDFDPRSGKVLYLGRVCDAESGLMLHELPYGSTDPKKMGRWWKRTTGQQPPEELSLDRLCAATHSRKGGHASVEAA
jgi:hypothetical protein